MLLDSLGKPIPFQRIKGLIIIIMIICVVSIGVAGISGYYYQKTVFKIKGLEKQLARDQDQVQKLKETRDLLMTRLVLTEIKLKSFTENKKNSFTSEPAALNPQKLPTKEKKIKAKTGLADFLVEDFSISLASTGIDLTARFKIKKTGSASGPVRGRATLLLRNSKSKTAPIITMPFSRLIQGRPDSHKGRLFRILKFKYLEFKTYDLKSPFYFDKATAYIFNLDGKLLLEKSFPLKIESKAPAIKKQPVKEPVQPLMNQMIKSNDKIKKREKKSGESALKTKIENEISLPETITPIQKIQAIKESLEPEQITEPPGKLQNEILE